MNYDLKNLPAREKRPRTSGVTMCMDKGLSVRQAADSIEVAGEHAL